jgi:hypothetical protein
MEPVNLPCSRNARPQMALVGRAQLEINQPPSLKRDELAWEKLWEGGLDDSCARATCSLRRMRRERPGALLARRTRTMNCASPMHAVEGTLGHSFKGRLKKRPSADTRRGDQSAPSLKRDELAWKSVKDSRAHSYLRKVGRKGARLHGVGSGLHTTHNQHVLDH